MKCFTGNCNIELKKPSRKQNRWQGDRRQEMRKLNDPSQTKEQTEQRERVADATNGNNSGKFPRIERHKLLRLGTHWVPPEEKTIHLNTLPWQVQNTKGTENILIFYSNYTLKQNFACWAVCLCFFVCFGVFRFVLPAWHKRRKHLEKWNLNWGVTSIKMACTQVYVAFSWFSDWHERARDTMGGTNPDFLSCWTTTVS